MKGNIDHILEELYSYSMFGIKLGLENIERICKALGNPQNEYKIIHIAGTNGKGSTATTIEAGLIEADYKVGKFTSPHILRFNERIQLNNKEITNKEICEYFLKVKEIAKEEEIKPTFFEVTTAMMFLYFKDMKIDYLVLETGMGGRFDATNIVKSDFAVITNISLDHTSFLGNDIYSIAKEKAGIIKKESKVIIGDGKEGLIKAVAEEKKEYISILEKYSAVKYKLNTENFVTEITLEGIKFEFSLFGSYQVNNFLCAYEVLKQIGIDDEKIKKAIKKVKWPGRFELLKTDPLVILDGAHNLDAAKRLKENIATISKKEDVVLIVSILEDKDRKEILKELQNIGKTIILTSLEDFKRGTKGEELKTFANGFTNVLIEEDIKKAYKTASKLNKKAIVICGSFYLLSKFKKEVKI